MTEQDRLYALKSTKLAQELTDDQIATLSDLVALRELPPGEVLAPEGPSDNSIHVILQGGLSVIKSFGTDHADTLYTVYSGDLVGKLSFIDGIPRDAALVAVDGARVLSLERMKLETLLHSDPEIVYRVMRAILRSDHQIQRRMSNQLLELTNYIYKQHGRY